MNVVGKVGSLISAGVYSVATPFHPFGGAVDIIVVQQQDGTFRTTPWYVRFGKFQGVLKGAEKMVRISVNGVEADFHMCLDNSGEAYFVKEVVSGEGSESKDSDAVESSYSSVNDSSSVKGEKDNGNICEAEGSVGESDSQLQEGRGSVDGARLERTESDSGRRFYEFQDDQSSLEGLSDYGSGRYESLDGIENYAESQVLSSEVILVSIDGHILTAPIPSLERNTDNLQLSTPQFHLGPGEGPDLVEDNAGFSTGDEAWAADYLSDLSTSVTEGASGENGSVTNASDPNGNQQEVSSGGQEHLRPVQENETISNHQEELCGDDNEKAGIRRDDVFKSCLELQTFGLHNEDANSKAENSPSENHDLANGLQDNDLQPADKSIVGDQTLSNPCTPTPSASPDLHVEVEHSDGKEVAVDVEHGENKESEEVVHDVRDNDGGHCSPQTPAFEVESSQKEIVEAQAVSFGDDTKTNSRLEISLCGNLLQAGMGLNAAREVFDQHRVSEEAFKASAASIIKNENLVIRFQERYIPWEKAAPIVLGMAAYSLELTVEPRDAIPVEQDDAPRPGELASTPSGRRWRLWPIPFRRVKTLEHTNSNVSSEDVFVDSESGSLNHIESPTPSATGGPETPRKQLRRTNVLTTEQISSLNLKEGQNLVTFSFSTRVWGMQQVDAHIYLWKWNARIVISDVDGTITKSDVLGQFMPLVGKDWTQSGVARLFSAIKENGYQLLFLSARAIVQAYLTRSFLINLKQDGKALPNGPVVISPDGLFPSLYREVIRRAPHEFKIACLEDIKALFPPDYNPFYAGFGNRDTDELSYRKIGIPKGKIFIINPKGEVAISHRIDVKSYTSLHTLVNDMFPPTSMVEQEDFNSWNYWRMPLPDVE